MLYNLPDYIAYIFVFAALATLLLFTLAVRNSTYQKTSAQSTTIFFILCGWLFIQTLFTLSDTYSTDLDTSPPNLVLLGIVPTLVTIAAIFRIKKGRHFIDSISLKELTYLHTVRIPVELVLYWLYQHHTLPKLMTFEGRNFDIIAGITAPFIAYYGITKGKLNNKLVLLWNFIGIVLLLNIVINAVLSAPFPMQQFAFDQPNVAVLYFPFSWLPTFIVPIVLFSHLLVIRRLLHEKKNVEIHVK